MSLPVSRLSWKEACWMRKRAIVVAFAAAAALVLAACSSSSTTPSAQQSTTAGKQVTVAFIYVGSPSDAGWTHQHDAGRLAVQSYFGSQVKTIFKENVPEGPQATSVTQQLVNSGAKIIFSTSFGYQPSMVAMAKKYPNVVFAQATGTAMGPHL